MKPKKEGGREHLKSASDSGPWPLKPSDQATPSTPQPLKAPPEPLEATPSCSHRVEERDTPTVPSGKGRRGWPAAGWEGGRISGLPQGQARSKKAARGWMCTRVQEPGRGVLRTRTPASRGVFPAKEVLCTHISAVAVSSPVSSFSVRSRPHHVQGGRDSSTRSSVHTGSAEPSSAACSVSRACQAQRKPCL